MLQYTKYVVLSVSIRIRILINRYEMGGGGSTHSLWQSIACYLYSNFKAYPKLCLYYYASYDKLMREICDQAYYLVEEKKSMVGG